MKSQIIFTHVNLGDETKHQNKKRKFFVKQRRETDASGSAYFAGSF
jgi:hypothetical protein